MDFWRLALESDNNINGVFITVRLSQEANKLLNASCKRSNRKKIQEAKLRLEDHLLRFRSISELNHTRPFENEAMEAENVCTTHT